VVNGPTLLKEAASILLQLPLNFLGFVCFGGGGGGGGNLTRGIIDVSVTEKNY
jgi:hypothetical protein